MTLEKADLPNLVAHIDHALLLSDTPDDRRLTAEQTATYTPPLISLFAGHLSCFTTDVKP